MKTKVLLSWSSGKDSAWALHALRQDPAIEVVGLFTTLNQAFERVAMHGCASGAAGTGRVRGLAADHHRPALALQQ